MSLLVTSEMNFIVYLLFFVKPFLGNKIDYMPLKNKSFVKKKLLIDCTYKNSVRLDIFNRPILL